MENSGDPTSGGLTLLVEPVEDVLAEVAQSAAKDEAARPGAQHLPVADGGQGHPQQLGDLLATELIIQQAEIMAEGEG